MAFYPSQPSCDIVLNRPRHQNSDRCPNRHNSVQMQWLWLCCYFQLETINNLETRSCKYIWQFAYNKSICLTFINHKTVIITSVFSLSFRFPNCFATTYQWKSENRCDGVGYQWPRKMEYFGVCQQMCSSAQFRPRTRYINLSISGLLGKLF